MKKHFAVIGDKYYHPDPDDDPLGERGHICENFLPNGEYTHDAVLRERARRMRSREILAGRIKPAGLPLWFGPDGDEVCSSAELLAEGMSFSIHDRHFGGLGVYARPLPSEVGAKC